MRRDPISSTTLRSVGYDPEDAILEIENLDGTVARYFDIPFEDYLKLVNAESPTAYVNKYIKGWFHFEEPL